MLWWQRVDPLSEWLEAQVIPSDCRAVNIQSFSLPLSQQAITLLEKKCDEVVSQQTHLEMYSSSAVGRYGAKNKLKGSIVGYYY